MKKLKNSVSFLKNGKKDFNKFWVRQRPHSTEIGIFIPTDSYHPMSNPKKPEIAKTDQLPGNFAVKITTIVSCPKVSVEEGKKIRESEQVDWLSELEMLDNRPIYYAAFFGSKQE